MQTINYKNKLYPICQLEGNATQYSAAYALKFCKGFGLDIGCNREEWKLPGSKAIDIIFNDGNDAYNFPWNEIDYIYSSHCLEHLPNWVEALDYWTSKLKKGGILFLYLPDYSQEYWRPWNNKKHIHIFTPDIIKDYMKDRGYCNVFNSEKDLMNSFMVVGEKQ